jgi:hypothetical protein
VEGIRTCPTTGKVAYDSPQQAARAKKKLARRRNAEPINNLNHYKCYGCDGWHLGRPRTVQPFKSMRAKPGNYQRY